MNSDTICVEIQSWQNGFVVGGEAEKVSVRGGTKAAGARNRIEFESLTLCQILPSAEFSFLDYPGSAQL
jgi:hypothetical protein